MQRGVVRNGIPVEQQVLTVAPQRGLGHQGLLALPQVADALQYPLVHQYADQVLQMVQWYKEQWFVPDAYARFYFRGCTSK